eukprot:TRINITY_DN28914_c0_g1_i2.p1 TRINITY_DN28914_c0_g1~~TRINITY_DN28914_c0_g1_i2.p1  ORF type:complete len:150 (+),score=43.66 TRINITY_DN28914_c0_g1_i2:215-664(+)
MLGSSFVLVLGFGAHEASLLCARPLLCPNGMDPDVLRFMCWYAYENVFISCIWGTKPAALVASSLQLEPDFLRVFSASPADAAVQLKIFGDATGRAMVAGFTLITQLVQVVNQTAFATEEFRKRVLSGTETPIDVVHGRVIRVLSLIHI